MGLLTPFGDAIGVSKSQALVLSMKIAVQLLLPKLLAT